MIYQYRNARDKAEGYKNPCTRPSFHNPRLNKVELADSRFAFRHKKCRDGVNCVGPGCVADR